MISQCIDCEKDASWLLNKIVKLYVTIRGFSIAAMWMEAYKQAEKQMTKTTATKTFSIVKFHAISNTHIKKTLNFFITRLKLKLIFNDVCVLVEEYGHP